VHPELIHEPYVPTYAVMQLTAFLAAIALAVWRARREGIAARHILILAVLLGFTMPIGARIIGRILTQDASENFFDIFRIWEPGGATVIYGGFIFGVAVVLEYSVFTRQSAAKLGDVFAPSIALGLCIGKLGCFFAGCCWGDVCVAPSRLAALEPELRQQVQTFPSVSREGNPLSVQFPKASFPHAHHVGLGLAPINSAASLPVHPVQLYESALALLLCVGLNYAFRFRKRAGEIFWLLGMSYGVVRFGTDFFRAGDEPLALGFTVAQWFSVLFAVVSGVALWWRRRSPEKTPDESKFPLAKAKSQSRIKQRRRPTRANKE
jgi:phosphatidylglycerol:prolipoprotein diacylglycerol transferase